MLKEKNRYKQDLKLFLLPVHELVDQLQQSSRTINRVTLGVLITALHDQPSKKCQEILMQYSDRYLLNKNMQQQAIDTLKDSVPIYDGDEAYFLEMRASLRRGLELLKSGKASEDRDTHWLESCDEYIDNMRKSLGIEV